jgi:hypothetical protein
METQIENKNPETNDEKILDKKEKKRQYYLKRYADNAEELRRKKREYYHANKERIAARVKELRVEKTGGRPVGRPKKYEIDG